MRYLLLSLLAVGCSAATEPCLNPNPLLDYDATVTVSEVVDGDTFRFMERGEELSVRILDLDAFETRRGDRLKEQAAAAGITEDSALILGKAAKAFADSVLTGTQVRIKRDSTEPNWDSYTRLLRHIVLPSALDYIEELKVRGLAF